MESKTGLAKKMAGILSTIKNPPLDSFNPHYKSKYASLLACLEVVKTACSGQGVGVYQDVESEVNGDNTVVRVRTVLEDGEENFSSRWLSGIVKNSDPNYIQSLGKVITYLRRYSLVTFLGIVGEEDDDGEDVVRPPTRPTPGKQEKLYPQPKQQGNPMEHLMGAGLTEDEARAAYTEINRDDLRRIFLNIKSAGKDAIQALRAQYDGILEPETLIKNFLR